MPITLVRDLEDYLGGRSKFRTSVNDHLIRSRDNRELRNRDGVLSPSAIGGCKEYHLNQLRGEKMENLEEVWSFPFFEVANSIHKIYQRIGLESGILRWGSVETSVTYDRWKIEGAIDGLLSNEPVVVDFKSCNNNIWRIIHNQKKPMKYHLWQQTCYMLATESERDLIVYINREDASKTREFEIPLDDRIVKEIDEFVKPILDKYEDGTDFQDVFEMVGCQGCRYFKHCLPKYGV